MDTFILSFFQQGDKLKASTVYQILIGKRSSSTLLYGYLWDLLPYWSVFPKMKKASFFQLLQEMVAKGWLTEVAPDYFVKTKMAPHLTEAQVEVVAGLQNFKFNKSAPVAWRLLRLLVQTASEYQRSTSFVPLETGPQYTEPVRQLVRSNGTKLRPMLYQELEQIFSQLPETAANGLALSFSGYQVQGLANYQTVAEELADHPWSPLALRSRQHRFFTLALQQPSFLTYQIIQPFIQLDQNHSAMVTKDYFTAGFTFQEVAAVRKLRPGTINDHLIEWAISDASFDYHRFLQPETLALLQQLPDDPRHWRYGSLPQKEAIDFLSFALYQIQRKQVMACY